ncbi:MAG: helix-turn-helix domain-containing protein [Streptosporangiaceae bacterium]
MRITSVHDLAAVARGRRLALGLRQAELAARMDVSRDWVNSFEAGKPRAELILVLRLLEALDLRLEVAAGHGVSGASAANSLDTLLDEYRTP